MFKLHLIHFTLIIVWSFQTLENSQVLKIFCIHSIHGFLRISASAECSWSSMNCHAIHENTTRYFFCLAWHAGKAWTFWCMASRAVFRFFEHQSLLCYLQRITNYTRAHRQGERGKCAFIALTWHGLMLMLKYYPFITTLIYLIIGVIIENYRPFRKFRIVFNRRL